MYEIYDLGVGVTLRLVPWALALTCRPQGTQEDLGLDRLRIYIIH